MILQFSSTLSILGFASMSASDRHSRLQSRSAVTSSFPSRSLAPPGRLVYMHATVSIAPSARSRG
jgi:hypothetical protein